MLFNSFGFLLIFLPTTLLLTKQLRGRALLFTLSLASFVFYSLAGHAWFLVPMLITMGLDFGVAPRIEAARSRAVRRNLLILSLSSNLGLLIYFKYSGLLLEAADAAATLLSAGQWTPQWRSALSVMLPAGISFYTFQTMSYVIDVYRGEAKAEKDFWAFASFVSFFPHLVAGPLTRHHQLLPGLKSIARKGIKSNWEAGVYLFTIGLIKKTLIADRIANLIDPPLLDPGSLSLTHAWLLILGYALQIYFDFSGYSDMAIGLGRLFGIELPQNFNAPYRALNPSDFWRRWHMTLSQWLRDYLYISLGGNRSSTMRRQFNVMITMVLGGLWHGANWTFAAWGIYHGLLLIAYQLLRKRWDRWSESWQRLITLALICLGWVFFRARSLTDAKLWIAAALGLGRQDVSANLTESTGDLFGLVVAGLMIVNLLPVASRYERYGRLQTMPQVILGALGVLALLFMNYSSRFLYFQF